MFTNIINNAIDAMPDGGELRIRAAMDRDDVAVSIEDTGCGIPEAIRDSIFDPFFTTKDIGSTGLGLSVSYGIITRHGGSIDVRSTVGAGTCFTLRIPAAEAAPHLHENPAELSTRRVLKILLIEDDKNVIETLSEMLQFSGHKVSLAENGAEGLRTFNDNPFDLVLTDLGMPGLTGFDVAQRIKQKNPAIPVVLITGWNLKMNPDELRARGVDYLIMKPFRIAQIINLIQHAVHA